ncbi:hypothetical protein [Microbacterium testaceum]|uniref:hypothetical protein n=1 Tax=Microbacterium enclense TaxID=993073 RepID=UPI0016498684|nr:hypothetical protein [Microbacterium testaceum]
MSRTFSLMSRAPSRHPMDSLESDLEEISEDAAHDVFQMAATRTYGPLHRR